MNEFCLKLETMEALKLKIFDVLIENIPIIEFEEWLYNSEEFMSQINKNTFYFDVISINYKIELWALKLNNLAKEYLNTDCLEILKIKKDCLHIIESYSFQETHKILNVICQNFDYDTDYSILWKLNQLNDYFGLTKDSFYKTETMQIEAKFYAKQTLEIIKKGKNFDELKSMLEANLKPFKTSKSGQKTTLKKKIFAFFKKL